MSSSPITKETIKHLAKLSRIELTDEEEDRILKDLGNILKHFEELQSLDTKHIAPITSGMGRMNSFREDDSCENTNQGAGTELFPAKESGALKIPPVFE